MPLKHGRQWKQKNIADGNQETLFQQVTNEVVGRSDGNDSEELHAAEEAPGAGAAVHGEIAKIPSPRSSRAIQEAVAADAEEAVEEERDPHPAKPVVNPLGPQEAKVEAREADFRALGTNEARVRAGIVRRRPRGSTR